MFKLIEQSGMPIYRNSENGLLAFQAPALYKGFSQKYSEQMEGLYKEKVGQGELMYDVYRDIALEKDRHLFEKYDFSYDFTVIRKGLIGNERKKTSGHYHSWNEMRTNTYAEVYEVLQGTAVYILQKVDNFECENPDDIKVDDLIVLKVEQGQSVIIPPNYGHVSINAGDGDLIFSNIAYKPCKISYGPVKYYHGMAVYLMEKDGKIQVEVNKNYKNLPKIKYAVGKENSKLGINFGKAAYTEFVNHPEKFDFLANPSAYVEEIMDMLEYKEEF